MAKQIPVAPQRVTPKHSITRTMEGDRLTDGMWWHWEDDQVVVFDNDIDGFFFDEVECENPF